MSDVESAETDIRTIGMVGLGTMGFPMVKHVVASGFHVKAFARRRLTLQAAAAVGCEEATSLVDLGQGVDAALLVLPDGPDVMEVLFGEGGLASAMTPGSLVIDCTTLSPTTAQAIARRLEGIGLSYLDAPVSGGERGAQEGALSVMVGGDEGAFRRAIPVLRSFGRLVLHMGDVGAGQVTKACNQLVVAGTIELVAEALVLAFRSGVPPDSVREALLGGLAFSRILEGHGLRMLQSNFSPGFRLRLQRKDALIVKDQADAVGAPTPAFDVVFGQIEQLAANHEHAELDHSALILALNSYWRRQDVKPH